MSLSRCSLARSRLKGMGATLHRLASSMRRPGIGHRSEKFVGLYGQGVMSSMPLPRVLGQEALGRTMITNAIPDVSAAILVPLSLTGVQRPRFFMTPPIDAGARLASA